LNNKYVKTHVNILVKRLSLLCVHVLQYFVHTHKILQNINTSKLNRFTRILTCVILREVAFLFVAVYQLFCICD